MNKDMPWQLPELYYGNKEYKWKFYNHSSTNHNAKLINKRASQLLFRLIEGKGKAIYMLGILDKGEPLGIEESELMRCLQFLETIVKIVGANIKTIRIYHGINGQIATVRIQKDLDYSLIF